MVSKFPTFTFIALTALAVLIFSHACAPSPKVTFTSDPPGATVWLGNEILGRTPCETRLPTGQNLRIRIAMPGYLDWQRRFEANELTAGSTVRVELRARQWVSVRFESSPSQTKVHINGEYRGHTPLTLTDLAPGETEVTMLSAGRETIRKTLKLAPSPEVRTVRWTLPGVTETVYRRRINDHPENLNNFADLAHYLTLQQRFEEAASVLEQGIRHFLDGKGHQNSKRLLQELQRIPKAQYDYGGRSEVKVARQAIAAMLEGILRDYPKAHEKVYRTQVRTLLYLGKREEATKIIKEAAVVHPKNRHIARLKRHFRLDR